MQSKRPPCARWLTINRILFNVRAHNEYSYRANNIGRLLSVVCHTLYCREYTPCLCAYSTVQTCNVYRNNLTTYFFITKRKFQYKTRFFALKFRPRRHFSNKTKQKEKKPALVMFNLLELVMFEHGKYWVPYSVIAFNIFNRIAKNGAAIYYTKRSLRLAHQYLLPRPRTNTYNI